MHREPTTINTMNNIYTTFRKLRSEFLTFLGNELNAKANQAVQVAAMFGLDEMRTLGSLYSFLDLDTFLFERINSSAEIISGRMGDLEDPPVYDTFGGNLA